MISPLNIYLAQNLQNDVFASLPEITFVDVLHSAAL